MRRERDLLLIIGQLTGQPQCYGLGLGLGLGLWLEPHMSKVASSSQASLNVCVLVSRCVCVAD